MYAQAAARGVAARMKPGVPTTKSGVRTRMKQKLILGITALSGAAIVAGQFAVNASTSVTKPATGADQPQVEPIGGVGGDVWVYRLGNDFANWSEGDYRAYSSATVSCNTGTAPLAWIANNNQHPVIHQAMFRLKPGQNGHIRFEQIGQSWLKHGFCALDLTECGQCQATGCTSLGINCNDPYTATRNAFQPDAGPKYDVNGTTGFFNYPPPDPSYSGLTQRRLRVLKSDVELASNAGAQYFLEGLYIHPDDSPDDDAGRAGNNASYRKAILAADGAMTAWEGNTVAKQSAIQAWVFADNLVKLKKTNIANEGSIRVAYRVYDNGNGTWDYEYAVQNLNIDRSFGAFSIPVPEGVEITNIGFHDVDYHSGEPYDGTDWAATVAGGSIRWATTPFAQNPSANALRWGTLYNFRFTANTGPVDAPGLLEYFKPGVTPNWTDTLYGPSALPVCDADVTGDGEVGFDDIVAVLNAWGACTGCSEDVNDDGDVGFDDILAILSEWGPC